MDLRVKKTRKSIVDAFIELRQIKPLEKITVKELASKAMINKATFYLHYQDIYDLEDSLESKLISSVLSSISDKNLYVDNPFQFELELMNAIKKEGPIFEILTSGNRSAHFVMQLEKELKNYISQNDPSFSSDVKRNIMVSFIVYGAYYTYTNNKYDKDILAKTLSKLTQQVIKTEL